MAHETKLRSYSALAHSCTSLIVKILWNLFCQYNSIYTSFHKYLKGEKNTNKLKKKNVAIVATVPLGTAVTVQNLGKKNKKKCGSWNQIVRWKLFF